MNELSAAAASGAREPGHAFASHYLSALLVTALCTALALPITPYFDAVNVVMIYVLGATLASLRLGRGPSALCAVANVAAFDFFFVPPRFSFYVAEPQYLFTFGVMLVVTLVISNLMVSVRRQTQFAAARERRQAALALERARLSELATASRAAAERAALRNTLLASISHDLRGPLSAIAGAGSLIAQSSSMLDRHRRTVLGQLIEEKARDMTELLTNVLDLMRLETATVPLRTDWHSLGDMVSTAIRNTQRRLEGRRVMSRVAADFPPLRVDGQLIVQLLSNLLDNVAKYTPPQTAVEIRAVAVDEVARITVEDDGPGFGQRDPASLFEKFERGGQAESAVSGFGLGLSICRAILGLHGGGIEASNRSEGGARFEIRLPLEPAREAPRPDGPE